MECSQGLVELFSAIATLGDEFVPCASESFGPRALLIVSTAAASQLLCVFSTIDAARLRARHSNWYAKTELKKVSIQDSFGKFNFLETDAAVNLRVSASSDQIGADVTRLVFGPSSIWWAKVSRQPLVR